MLSVKRKSKVEIIKVNLYVQKFIALSFDSPWIIYQKLISFQEHISIDDV